MRLLKCNNDGEFGLTEDFVGGEIPEYAILSHTWGADTEEVTYRDLIDGTGKNKVGYEKIRFCGERARRDGLHNFWVDTCCINKSSDRELSEAINSMFRWYRKAAKCYVYLTDVSTNNQIDLSLQPWEAAFENSRWFTRGWTLQELIAPPSVEFFCSNGNRLGDKKSLKGQLHKITGIPVSALQSSSLSEFSFDERILWAQLRETKREEDKAYSLLGVFDISMPVIYGEGKENAFRRLNREWKYRLDELRNISQAISNCGKSSATFPFQSSAATSRHVLLSPEASTHNNNSINNLPYAAEAPFNTYQRQHEPPCLDNTRVDILHEIHTWAERQDGRCIFWLSGLAGTGKSTIARTIARKFFEETSLGASFFFSRGGGDISHAGKFFTSIAKQLANTIPLLNQHICDAVTNNSDIANQSLRDQWQQLVLRPLSKLDGNNCRSSYVVVIDAIDECDGDNDIRMILQLLAEARSLRRVRLRIFLTSRPEIPVRHGLSKILDTEYQDSVLHRISPAIVDHDISLFLEYNLGLIGQELCLSDGWPGKETVGRMVWRASGLFIWAATACRFIRDGKRFAAKRLDIILHSSGSTSTAPEKYLDEIYTTVLKQSVSPDYSDEEKKESYRMLKKVLGSVVTLFSPLPIHSVTKMLCVTKEDINLTLEDLHSILDSPEDPTHPIHLHHPSFRDFLLNEDRCKDPNFWVDEKQAHQTLADSCIRLMSISLKQDICGQNTPGLLVINVEPSRVQHFIPPEIQYASLYWIQHLRRSSTQLHDNDQVHQFLQKHFLHWLEALGWMGKVSEGIYAIAALESIALVSDCSDLYAFIHDMKRFALYVKQLIEQAPLQVYYSALVFTPMMSIMKKKFEDRLPQWIQQFPEVENHWSAVLQTLEGHSESVRSVAFSHDSKLLASASDDKTVKIWDAASGTLQQTLEGHSGSVNSVAFSHDSKLLASASNNKPVKIWDTASGTLQQTLEGHSSRVKSVTFSHDSKLLASASRDKTVKIWYTASGTLQQTLEGHSGSVNSVAFSHDSKLLASVSNNKTVKIWDTASGTLQQTLDRHNSWVKSVAFSHDSKLLASASRDKTVKIWDAASGTLQQTLEGHSGSVNSVAFSHDSKLLVSASDDETVKIWDAASGTLQQTLEGHSDWVKSVAFSYDSKLLASASSDNTVKIWDAASGTPQQTLEKHSDWVNLVTFSHDSKLLASASDDKTIKIWDATSGTLQKTLEGHSDWVKSVAFSYDSKLLASASRDKTVKIWDAASGTLQQTFEGHSSWVNSVTFSRDSKLLASASRDETVKIWDMASGTLQQTLEGHSGSVSSVAFSHDSKLLASASDDKTVKIWNAASGRLQQTLAVDSHVSTLSFDATLSILITNIGHFKIAETGIPLLPISQEISGKSDREGLGISGPWVTWNDQNILWLPPSFRATTSDVSLTGSTLAIGCSSGKVFFIGISMDILRRYYA